ncbi:hypothetical protein QUA70_07375 [Microcoleus sp. LAD1_D5]|uniref:hypothetical protein n=1 Tax=unclassified Microcoleus TaxID=2642155 RepID=UPI002FCF03EF
MKVGCTLQLDIDPSATLTMETNRARDIKQTKHLALAQQQSAQNNNGEIKICLLTIGLN